MMTATMDPHRPHHHAHSPDAPAGDATNERGRIIDPDASDDERTLCLFGHLSAVLHLFLPFIAIAAPIVIWAVKKDKSPYVADHMKEAINFHITLVLYSVLIPIVWAVVGVLTLSVGLFMLLPLFLVPYALGLVGIIMASLAANRGEYFRYPMTIRFVR